MIDPGDTSKTEQLSLLLDQAIGRKNHLLVQDLLEQGADPNKGHPFNNEHIKPLHKAAMGGDFLLVKVLLLAGANPLALSVNGSDALRSWLKGAMDSHDPVNIETGALLISAGCSMDVPAKDQPNREHVMAVPGAFVNTKDWAASNGLEQLLEQACGLVKSRQAYGAIEEATPKANAESVRRSL